METKKLTAKDLMVWDYMKYKDGTIVKIARVGDVSPMDAPIYCYTKLEGYFPCQLDDLAPIPLTAEILEKNGFVKKKAKDNCHYRFETIVDGIGFGLTYVRSVFQWLGPLDFKYVHELQHALRLCGVDKEITL